MINIKDLFKKRPDLLAELEVKKAQIYRVLSFNKMTFECLNFQLKIRTLLNHNQLSTIQFSIVDEIYFLKLSSNHIILWLLRYTHPTRLELILFFLLTLLPFHFFELKKFLRLALLRFQDGICLYLIYLRYNPFF